MADDIVFNEDLLNVVDSWSKNAKQDPKETTVTYEKRPLRLGLGAKYVPHKTEVHKEISSKLLKKINKDKSKMKQKIIERNENDSDSDEDFSRLQAISKKSKSESQNKESGKNKNKNKSKSNK